MNIGTVSVMLNIYSHLKLEDLVSWLGEVKAFVSFETFNQGEEDECPCVVISLRDYPISATGATFLEAAQACYYLYASRFKSKEEKEIKGE